MGDNVIVNSGVSIAATASPQTAQQKTDSVDITRPSAEASQAIHDMGIAKAAVQNRVSEVNAVLREMDRDFGLRMDDTLNRPVVTLVKHSTGEVVQQLPSEAFLKAAKNIKQLTGILLQLKG
jgi:uncharacterized FlaG/YvyC family protein